MRGTSKVEVYSLNHLREKNYKIELEKGRVTAAAAAILRKQWKHLGSNSNYMPPSEAAH